MKAIMMSIKPEWIAKILNKEKTIEVRKRFPINYVGWVYIYCTKKYDECLWYKKDSQRYVLNYGKPTNDYLNGKVVARFWCKKVEKIRSYLEPEQWYATIDLGGSGLLQKSCLSFEELDDYLLSANGCAIHITKLEIFDKPKEISEFKHYKKFSEIDYMLPVPRKETCERLVPLTRAPQSWCYAEI